MSVATPTISPLRQRMIEDMRMRKLADKTQTHYIRAVRQFTVFLGRSPDTASTEDLRRYQLHLVDHGISPVSLNAAITELKFFFEVSVHVLGKGRRERALPYGSQPQPHCGHGWQCGVTSRRRRCSSMPAAIP
jgi:site-specific recombinase XerD